MRHRKKTVKLGRTAAHRKALLANQICSLIEHSRIKTTLAKAKAVRPLAEKMVTLGKNASLHARRTAFSVLRQADAVAKLFGEVAPRAAARNGGYTRIVKLGYRKSDAAPLAFLEWVDLPQVEETEEPAPKKKARKTKQPATAKEGETAAKSEKKSPAKKPKKAKVEATEPDAEK